MKPPKASPPAPLNVGDVVNVLGCHSRYQPTIVTLHDDGTATVRSPMLPFISGRRLKRSKLRPADPKRKRGKRR